MSNVIQDYSIAVEDNEDNSVLRVPKQISLGLSRNARILDIQLRHGAPTMWVLLNLNDELIERTFDFYLTDEAIDSHPGKHLGTFQLHNGDYVVHVFEKVASTVEILHGSTTNTTH